MEGCDQRVELNEEFGEVKEREKRGGGMERERGGGRDLSGRGSHRRERWIFET